VKHERIYLGGVEIYREYDSSENVHNERHSQHVSDGAGNTALLEVKTIHNGHTRTGNELATTFRFQYNNHLGSSALELNENQEIISYGAIA
jgi:hypothetical protein